MIFRCLCLFLFLVGVGSVVCSLVILMVGEELFGLESSHASSTGTGNGLSVSLVLDVTSGKDTLDVGVRSARDSLDVAILVHVNLALDKGSGGVVTDGVEETIGLVDLLLSGFVVLDNEMAHETILTTSDFGRAAVELDCDLGVVEETVGHGSAGTEDIAADEDSNVACILGEESSLLGGRITTADNEEGLVAEDGDGSVTDSAGGDTILPVLVLTREVETASRGAGGDDNGVGGVCLLGGELGAVLEGSRGEIEGGDGVGDNFCAEALGLGSHVVHQLSAHDTLGETGEVLNLGGSGQLATSSNTIGHEALIENGLQFSSCQVDSSCVGSRP